MTSPPLLVAMSDTNPDQPYGSAPIGPGHGLPDYNDLQFLDMYNPDQHNMEGCPASPPSSLSQWDSPSSIPPPTPFPNYLDLSWAHSFNDPGSGFRSASYSDGFTQDPLISANTQLPGPSYFDDFPIIGEGSSGSVVGNPPEFPSLFTHAETAHLSRGLPAGVIPGPHSRSEHEEPLSPPTGQFQTRGYPMHSYESPLSTVTEDMDYKKNPELMRSNWMADYGRFVDSSKVFKIFSKHAKEKVATINTIKASAARRTNPAKFKCQIRGCNADFTRKHNLENHIKSHCGVTDRICGLCGKGFTTIPVWKRHQKSCEKAASSSKTATPKRFLDAVTAQRPA